MAINPSSLYPANIDTSDPTGYPRGKARDVAVAGDNTGTPLTAAIMNDIFGFQQALLSEASAVPSGTPDKVGASQYLDALKTVVANSFGGRGSSFVTSSGAFTPPAGVKHIKITCIGGGGGGGGAHRPAVDGHANCGGGGGGSGGISVRHYAITDPNYPPTFNVTLGIGGAGGTSTTSAASTTNGVTGGTTSVTVSGVTVCSAVGGEGGVRSGDTFLAGRGGRPGAPTIGSVYTSVPVQGNNGTIASTNTAASYANYTAIGGSGGSKCAGGASTYGDGGDGGSASNAAHQNGTNGNPGAVSFEY